MEICQYCRHDLEEHVQGKCNICGCKNKPIDQSQTAEAWGSIQNKKPRFRLEISTRLLLVGIGILCLLILVMGIANVGGTEAIASTLSGLRIGNISGTISHQINKSVNQSSASLKQQITGENQSINNHIQQSNVNVTSAINQLGSKQVQLSNQQNKTQAEMQNLSQYIHQVFSTVTSTSTTSVYTTTVNSIT